MANWGLAAFAISNCPQTHFLYRLADSERRHLTPDVQAKLDRMARDAGRQPAEVIEDAVIGLYDELAYTREMLDRRYDEMESGKVQGIDGEEAYRRLILNCGARTRACSVHTRVNALPASPVWWPPHSSQSPGAKTVGRSTAVFRLMEKTQALRSRQPA
jgi:hypothetical protein